MSIAVGTTHSAHNQLWSRRDEAVLGVLLAVGAVLMLAGWFFAAGRADAGDQLAFVSLALVGALVGLAAVVGWVMHGRRMISARRGLLLGSPPEPVAEGALAADLVSAATGKWFHRADCLLAHGRDWSVAPRAEHESAGRLACPGCRP
jgi:hypothetical protein